MFNNAGHALEWAYNTINKPIVKMSGINHMRQDPTTGVPNSLLINLTVQDRHSQAALIISMIERLSDQAEREYLRARFGREVGQKDIHVLVYRGCDALGFGISGQGAVYKVMRSYLSGRVMGYREIQRLLGCRNQYAIMVKNCLYDVLDRYHDRAMADIAQIFEQHGLIAVTRSYA